MSKEIINRVTSSSLIIFDLEHYYQEGSRKILDLAPILEQGLVLREKTFRDFIKRNHWSAYQGSHVAVSCSSDAIVPAWAYMLIAVSLEPFAKTIVFGDLDRLEERLFLNALSKVDWSIYEGAKLVVKGCSKVRVPESIFLEVASRLRPVAYRIMFGEACSAVPVFKKK